MVLPPTPGAPMMSPIRDRAIDSRLKAERATWWGRAGEGRSQRQWQPLVSRWQWQALVSGCVPENYSTR